MVGFFSMTLWGVRLWILLYLVLSLVLGVAVAIYWFREKIKEKYYKLRWPEKVIKCIVYYPNHLYKVYWRLIPKGDFFEIDKQPYYYNDKDIVRNNDLFVNTEDINKMYVMIEGKKYDVSANVKLKEKWSGHWPELHYKFGKPSPLDYAKGSGDVEWSSNDIKAFEENDLWMKLLTMDQQKSLMILILMAVAINFIATMVILAKMMGWIK